MKYINSCEGVQIDEQFVSTMAKKFLLDERVVRLLYARGIKSEHGLREYLNPSLKQFNNPYLFENMALVIEKIKQHITNNSKILIYGDYDVDGITATATMYDYLSKIGANVSTFLPNRYIDGYGLNLETINKVLERETPDLIITVDCGITAVEEVKYLQSKGIDIIVTDHHESDGNMPDCLIINPKVSTTYPFKYLCGAGVALKVVQALGGMDAIMPYLATTAIATISDIVEMIDENRAIVSIGLTRMDTLPKGLLKLLNECGMGRNPKANEIAFKLAPKINASGRMGDADLSLQLYLETKPAEINKICKTILNYNTQRQQLCNKIYNDVKDYLNTLDIYSMKAIVCKSNDWEAGLLGIVCAKLSEEYHRPTCLFSDTDGVLTGSCRSVNGVNVHTLMCSMSDILEKFGGHTMAAGLTLKVEHYDEFCEKFNDYVDKNLIKDEFLPTKIYDFEISLDEANIEFIESVERMEPCGHENLRPVFKLVASRADVSPMKSHPEHLLIKYPNLSLLAFNMAPMQYILASDTKCNILTDLNIETFKNIKRVTGIIKSVDYEDIYRPEDKGLLAYNYLHQLSFEDGGEHKFINYTRENLIRLLVDMEQSIYGTLIIANDYNSYLNFKSIYDNLNIFRNRLFEMEDETGLNTILLSPNSFKHFNSFKRIIFIDPILNLGYISELNKNTKSAIYIPHKTPFSHSFFRDISVERKVFGDYFKVLKFAYDNQIIGNSPYQFYQKVVNATRRKLSYMQFMVCLTVFKQLDIIQTEGDIKITNLSMDKKELSSSIFYNQLSLTKSTK
ncbi:MAG: single-stranded-DNA-specific exonuclease RecJ [Clostridia bacterium]|nr:single-stranded-DNA-specific exonuclease RecJ [Clostridia bacterium]